MTSNPKFVLAGVLFLFVLLTIGLAYTRPPSADEGHGANAAEGLLQKGIFAFPMSTAWLPGLDRRNYAVMPLYFIGLAGWVGIFGSDYVTTRLFSIVWGILLILSWYGIARKTSPNPRVALLAAVLVGLNYDIVNCSSTRYEVMIAALSAAGLAAYLLLRERSLDRAILISNLLFAASLMTHPYGGFSILGFLIYVFLFDRGKIRFRHLVLAAIPYAIAFGAWGIYIAQEYQLFRLQFFQNASDRLLGVYTPWRALVDEIVVRYVQAYGGWRSGVPVYMRVKLLVLLTYLVAIGICVATPSLRRQSGIRFLLIYTGAVFVGLTLFEGHKWYAYLIYILPLYSILLAAACSHLIDVLPAGRPLVVAGVAALTVFTIVSVVYRVRINTFGNLFLPASIFLQQQVKGNDLVMAGGEFGFGLGFEKHVADDPTLGFETGRVPTYVVVSKDLQNQFMDVHRAKGEAVKTHIENILKRYKVIYDKQLGADFYRIYAAPSVFER